MRESPSDTVNAASATLDERLILSVSDLTRSIKGLLEAKFKEVWVRGEISNMRVPASGHAYFTLKDEGAQIKAVMFRGRLGKIKFQPQDGMEVLAMGKVTIYEPQGNYQVMVEFLEPAGLGALQARFEQLKEKLDKEGLFAPARKRALPFFPRRIGIVTSKTGAAIRDMIHVISRRNSQVGILLAACKVQGEGSAEEIAQAINDLNQYNSLLPEDSPEKLDVLIIGRGGGSLEDLWAFNEEVVARAVFASALPIISAVGHEIDFTISDFVADVRAPTPSAAAEIAVPVLNELKDNVRQLRRTLERNVFELLKNFKKNLRQYADRLIRPDRRLADLRLRLAEWTDRLAMAVQGNLTRQQGALKLHRAVLLQCAPTTDIARLRQHLAQHRQEVRRAFEKYLLQCRNRFDTKFNALGALSPLNILNRGYSVVRLAHTKALIENVAKVKAGQEIEVLHHSGSLFAAVTGQQPGKATPGAEQKKRKAATSRIDQGKLF